MEDTDMNWRKSSRSNGGANACVEVASADSVLVRDTTDRDGGALTSPAAHGQRFVTGLSGSPTEREPVLSHH